MKPPLLVVILAVFCLAGCIGGKGAALKVDPYLRTGSPRNAITYLGHACSYIDINGVGIITDPMFDGSYSLFHKRKIAPPPRSAYAEASIILISHAHRDHLSPETLARFSKETTILCSAPCEKKIPELGMTVKVLKPGDSYTFQGGTITAVPALHPGGRNSLKAGADGRAIGFIIRTPRITLYYSGDTDYFDGFRDIGKTYQPDLAILNINGHLNSSDAVRAVVTLGVTRVIPSHYGAYTMFRADKSAEWLAELEETLGPIFVPVKIGESYPLPIKHLAETP